MQAMHSRETAGTYTSQGDGAALHHPQPSLSQMVANLIPAQDEQGGDPGQSQTVIRRRRPDRRVQGGGQGAGEEGPARRRIAFDDPSSRIVAIELVEPHRRRRFDILQADGVAQRRHHEQPHAIIPQRHRQLQAGEAAAGQWSGEPRGELGRSGQRSVEQRRRLVLPAARHMHQRQAVPGQAEMKARPLQQSGQITHAESPASPRPAWFPRTKRAARRRRARIWCRRDGRRP